MGEDAHVEHGFTHHHLQTLLDRFRVTGGKVDLDEYPTGNPFDTLIKSMAPPLLHAGVQRLATLQALFYANATWSVLLLLQGMDAAGKDGTVRHVLSGVNPAGVTVTSFKQPTSTELAHPFLWRINQALPARGIIGVFNRSHYEDVVITRVHPALLQHSQLPSELLNTPRFWDKRIEDIAAFERYLTRQGTRVVKVFLHVSRATQRKRLLSRLHDPAKHWKFNESDLTERAFWGDYVNAYQSAFNGTATPNAPWYIVPADQKWFARLVVAAILIDEMERLHLTVPALPPERAQAIAAARAAMEHGE